MKIITKQMRDRLIWREGISRQYDAAFTLSFRGARFVSLHACREDVVRWLNRQSTPNTRGLGRKTYAELCQAFGMAVPAKGSSTLGAQLAKAHQRIAELEQELAHFMELHGRTALPPETRITVNGKTFCLADIDKEMAK